MFKKKVSSQLSSSQFLSSSPHCHPHTSHQRCEAKLLLVIHGPRLTKTKTLSITPYHTISPIYSATLLLDVPTDRGEDNHSLQDKEYVLNPQHPRAEGIPKPETTGRTSRPTATDGSTSVSCFHSEPIYVFPSKNSHDSKFYSSITSV